MRQHSAPIPSCPACPRHITLEITPTPVDTFPSVSGGFAGHSNGKLLIFICLLDFCAGLHILEVGYVMICRSSWISTQKRTPSGVAAPDGVFLLVLTALAHQAVKPLAQIIGYYLCYATATTAASGGNREELLGPRPARCECRPRHEADAGSRNPSGLSLQSIVSLLPERRRAAPPV